MVLLTPTKRRLQIAEIANVPFDWMSSLDAPQFAAVRYGPCKTPGCDCPLFDPAFDGALVCQRAGCGHSWSSHT
jgi:hypothetical protein